MVYHIVQHSLSSVEQSVLLVARKDVKGDRIPKGGRPTSNLDPKHTCQSTHYEAAPSLFHQDPFVSSRQFERLDRESAVQQALSSPLDVAARPGETRFARRLWLRGYFERSMYTNRRSDIIFGH
jgi:hypothetical protein